MKSYSVSFIALSLLFVLVSCSNQDKKQTQSVEAGKTEFKFDLEKDYLEQLNSWYRLKPDQRFIQAIPEIFQFFTREPKQEVEVQFNNGFWNISYSGEEIGSIKELPDFQEFMVLLKKVVVVLQEDNPVEFTGETPKAIYQKIRIDVDRFLKSNLISALQEIDSRWNRNKYEKELIPLASRGLTYLAVQQYDKMETADQVYAKAIAFLAIAQVLSDDQMKRCESLLAYTLGYSNYAVANSESLSDTDPVKHYIRQDLTALKNTLGKENKYIQQGKYLTLLTLAKNRRNEEFSNWMKKYYQDNWFSLPLLKASLELESFSQTRAQASVVPMLVITDIIIDVVGDSRFKEGLRNFRLVSVINRRDPADLVDSLFKALASNVVENFESNLNYVDSKYKGPFLDAGTYKEFYKGYFFSSLYRMGYFYLKMLSSAEAANNFADYLGRSSSGIAGDIQKWFNHLVASKSGNYIGDNLMNDLIELTNIGAAPLTETVDEQLKYFSFGDPFTLDLIKLITARMDTRINHRIKLGDYAYSELYDVRMSFELKKSVRAAASETQSRTTVWLARKEKDYSTLVDMLRSNDTDLDGLLGILYYLEDHLDINQIEKSYDRIIKKYPDNYGLCMRYSNFLRRNTRFRKAERIIKDWEKRDVLTTGLEHILVKVYLSDIYFDQGKYQKAYNTVEPKIDSYQSEAMFRGVKYLYKLGREREADQLAVKLINRYPDGFRHRLNVAGIYWQYGKYSEASKLLKDYPYPIGSATWQNDITNKFYFALENKSEKEVLAAFDNLIQNGFPQIDLRYITYLFHKKGNSKLAFEMVTRLKVPGRQNFFLQMSAYKYLKAYTDKHQALDWLKKSVQVKDLNPISVVFYKENYYDLLWDFLTEPEKGSYPGSVWLIRAAAYVTDSIKNDLYRKKLSAYFDSDPPDYYHQAGKFLMDFITKEDLLSEIDTYKKLCEMSFFIGIKEKEKGNDAEAAKWFRIVIETKRSNEVEYIWSLDKLYDEYIATLY
jgi:hypothetical protein